MCPYIAGGRSRRGSPKAGTTVYRKNSMTDLFCVKPNIPQWPMPYSQLREIS